MGSKSPIPHNTSMALTCCWRDNAASAARATRSSNVSFRPDCDIATIVSSMTDPIRNYRQRCGPQITDRGSAESWRHRFSLRESPHTSHNSGNIPYKG